MNEKTIKQLLLLLGNLHTILIQEDFPMKGLCVSIVLKMQEKINEMKKELKYNDTLNRFIRGEDLDYKDEEVVSSIMNKEDLQ